LGNCSNQLHEADRSQTLENKDDYSNIVFTDLLEKIMITENAPTKVSICTTMNLVKLNKDHLFILEIYTYYFFVKY